MIKQRPPVQGTPSQQSPVTVQIWPYPAQGGGASVPASGGGGGGASGGGVTIPPSPMGGWPPHTPRVEPGVMTHGNPGQQSAPVVQVPPAPTQMPPQTKTGTLAPASGVKLGLGTQGRPQQSTLVAQA